MKRNTREIKVETMMPRKKWDTWYVKINPKKSVMAIDVIRLNLLVKGQKIPK